MSPFERLRGAHLTSHPVFEDFLFSVLSILVMIVAVVAVTMPQSATVTAAMAAGKPANPVFVAFYGTLLDAQGSPMPGAQIVLSDPDGTIMASTTTDANGVWELRFKDERNMPKTYELAITVMIDGQPVTGTTEVTASTGMDWGVQLVFAEPSTWVFVPLPGY